MPDPLRPFEPTATHPWDRRAAAHLLRRAGFAPDESSIRRAVEEGVDATIERLLSDEPDCAAHRELDDLGKALAVRNDIDRLRGWWLLRMCRTERPLRARMALLWHDHFATSNTKVASAALMLQQLRTLERHALAPFEQMLLAVARDPAMIVWLDGNLNIKGRPNENFARELFELFSLGEGNYTEDDIREAARAFTGWHQRRGRHRFVPGNHDDGGKTVLGTTGRLNGDDVVRIALRQPACGRFLADRLLREFVTPAPDPELRTALAATLRRGDYDLAATLRVLLRSAAFHDPRHYRARIKSPVEFAVGIVRSLGVRAAADELSSATSQMGQRLFEPPSVEGWKGHRAWLNSATMLVRMNAATTAVEPQRFDPDALLAEHAASEDPAGFFGNLLLDGVVPAALRAELDGIGGAGADRTRRQVRLLLTAPEYQLC